MMSKLAVATGDYIESSAESCSGGVLVSGRPPTHDRSAPCEHVSRSNSSTETHHDIALRGSNRTQSRASLEAARVGPWTRGDEVHRNSTKRPSFAHHT
jgi:hypothetical protein